MGLYGGLKAQDIKKRKNLKKSQDILDHMGYEELAANLFRATQTDEKLRRDQVVGKKEAGDVLFSLINLFRWYKISGENALNRTNTKFRQRFLHVEACVNQSDRSWEDFSLAELDAFWEEAKVQEK